MWRRTPLLAAVVVFAVAGVAVAMRRPAPSPPPVEPQPALPVLVANYRLADRIELVHGGTTVWLERRGQVWGVSQAGGYPVQPAKAALLIDGLMALKLDRTVDAPPAPEAAGTLVRVLALSGQVLGAIIVGPEPGIVRRPGLPGTWRAEPPLWVSADPDAWLDRRLPAPDTAHMTLLDGDATREAALRHALAALEFTEVRAGPQIPMMPVRSIRLTLPDGAATLAIGHFDGREWLKVSGSSAWARGLAAYAFAILPGSLGP